MATYIRNSYNYVTKDESFRALLPVNLSFFFISVSLYGASNIAVIVLDSTDPPINGYKTQTLNWAVCIPTPLLLPFLVRYVHIKHLMILWSVGYTLQSVMLIYPLRPVVYAFSAIGGFANTVSLSVGNVLIATVSRRFKGSEAKNSGLWYFFQMASLLLSNTIVYIAFRGQSEITDAARYAVSIPLTAVGVIGVIVSFFVDSDKCDINPSSLDESDPKVIEGHGGGGHVQIIDTEGQGNLAALSQMMWAMVRTFKDWRALCLYSTALFLGMECGFWMGVAQTSVGYSLYIDKSKEIMGVMGFCVGIGEITASFLYTGLSSAKSDNGLFSWLCMATGLIGYYLLFLVLPIDANIGRTYDLPYYTQHTLPLLVLSGLMIGASDYLINAQFTSVFCKVFKHEDSTPYFSVQYVIIGIGGALLFYTGDQIQLHWQLLVLSVLAVEACFVFMFFDVYASASNERKDSQDLDM